MRHCRSHELDAWIIKFHANLAMKDLQQGAIPILLNIAMRGKTLVDKLPQVSDRLASVPVGNAEVAYRILCEAIETLTKSLVVSFHIVNNHAGAAVFVKVTVFRKRLPFEPVRVHPGDSLFRYLEPQLALSEHVQVRKNNMGLQ
jgi:hypothetical protein